MSIGGLGRSVYSFLVRAFCFLALCIISCIAFSMQNPDLYFRHFTAKDGLPDNVVNCIAEDANGYMWFGTSSGLSRFDGERWITFVNNKSDNKSLCGNIVKHLVLDQTGKLWVATEDGGICKYDPDLMEFEKISFEESSFETVTEFLDMVVSPDSMVFVSLDKIGVFTAGLNDKLLKRHIQFDDSLNMRYFSLLATNRGLYGGQLARGLKKIGNDTIENFSLIKNNLFPYPGHTPVGLHKDEFGIIWSGSWDNGLYQFDESNNSWVIYDTLGSNPLSHSDDEIISIASTGHLLWLGTKRSGLYLYNYLEKKFYNYTHRFLVRSSISSNEVKRIFKDSRGLIWIATTMGLNLYYEGYNHFKVFYLNEIPEQSDFGDPVTGIANNANHMMVSSLSGLWYSQSNIIEFQKLTSDLWEPSETFHSVFNTSNDNFFTGTTKTAYRLSPSDGFTPQLLSSIYLQDGVTFDFYNIFSSRIVEIGEATVFGRPLILFSVFGHGMVALNEKNSSGIFTFIKLDEIEATGSINRIFTDADQAPWILTRTHGILASLKVENRLNAVLNQAFSNELACSGLCLVKDTLKIHATAHYNPQQSQFSVLDMIEDKNGVFYIIAEGNGLLKFEPHSDEKFVSIPSRHFQYEGMRMDSLGRIWLIATGGFDVYETKTGNWHRINISDGLPEKGVKGKIYQDLKGDFIVGSYGAIVKFNPYDILFVPDVPHIKITGFNVSNSNADHLLANRSLRLSHTDNFLSFSFSTLNYMGSDNFEYKYRLDGVNQNWISSGNLAHATYTNLKGGKYTFEVQAVNSSGIASDIASFAFVIVPPFYERWWFYTLLFLLLGLSIFGLYKYRISQYKQLQSVRLKSEIDAQEKERKRLARDLHDDLGTRLSTLKLYLSSMENYLKPSNEAKSVKVYAEDLLDSSVADLRNMLLNLSPETVTKYGFFHALEDLAAQINHSGIIKVSLRVIGNKIRFAPDAELAFYRICQELVNNSLKHAECSEIQINVMVGNENISLLYEDNGKGMNLTEKSDGYGFQNIANRLNLIQGTVSWDSAPDRGLRAVIEVNIGKTKLPEKVK
jgi:signal transduction histidine kinase/ligand-binding sensor domain-containing protein